MDEKRFAEITGRFAGLRMAVVGDLFLDRILYVNRAWDEPSVETGLTAYQVERRLNAPGAAGVVTNNLYSLGVGKKYALNVLGDDGEAYDLCKALAAMDIDTRYMVTEDGRFTPTYCKTFFTGETLEETHRLDLRNRSRMSRDSERKVTEHLLALEPKVDAIVCLEQVPNGDYGVFTQPVIDTLKAINARGRARVLVDSRFNIGRFAGMTVKCNDHECLHAAGVAEAPQGAPPADAGLDRAIKALQNGSGSPIFVTCGARGMKLYEGGQLRFVPGYRVSGPVDTCGAGDSALTGIACALCAGATPEEAALLGNLVASLIIEQLGVTGVATLPQLTARFHEYIRQQKEETS